MYAAVSAAFAGKIVSLGANEVVGGFAYQVVQLDGAHTLVDTRDNLLGDSSCIDVFGVEPVTQPRDTSSDLVELHAFLAPIYVNPR
jgi:hypothetical protein